MKALDPFIQFASTGFSAIADVLTGLTGGGFDFKKTKASVIRTEDASQNLFGGSADIYGRYDSSGNLKMANGGIVTKPTRALIGEAGPEAVVPLSKELKVDNSKMEKSLAEIASLLSKQSFSPVGLYEIQ